MESSNGWQTVFLGGIASWVVFSSLLNVTQMIRSKTQPWVSRRVISGTPTILKIQKYQHRYLDAFFSGLSCVVSVPFYTAFLPFLFWSGHAKLARQMTLLMAFCDYIGNCIKDVVSASRPNSPPVKRITATKDEKENALEYGLPSSHTLNTVCLSGYLFQYILSYNQVQDVSAAMVGLTAVILLVGLIGLGRVYLGMHSLIDIIGGLVSGLAILGFWLFIHKYVDDFIISGQNVASFWAVFSFLLLFAYPTPELPTPSFEYHTAFNGVALGIVIGIQQTYHQFHHENVPHIFTAELTGPAFVGRVLVGLPTILLVKFCSKGLAKWTLPMLASIFSIPVKSTSYIPALFASPTSKICNDTKQTPGYIQKLFFFSHQTTFDVDTGIRLLQYAGLAWSVVDLVPYTFSLVGL